MTYMSEKTNEWRSSYTTADATVDATVDTMVDAMVDTLVDTTVDRMVDRMVDDPRRRSLLGLKKATPTVARLNHSYAKVKP